MRCLGGGDGGQFFEGMEDFRENSKRPLSQHPPLADEDVEVEGPFHGTTRVLFLTKKS